MSILITGATGCVGTYLVREFLANTDHDLVITVRDAGKLDAAVRSNPRIRVVVADLRDLETIGPALAGVDTAILVATAWGGPQTRAVTHDANVALTDKLAAAGCSHVLYFATASVLASDGGLLPAARELGTEYIQAKFDLVSGMEARSRKVRITGLFPTLVFGGDPGTAQVAGLAPLSHFARLLTQLAGWMWLIRFFGVKARLHVIHAADIATVTRHLCANDAPASETAARIVLGNPASSVNDLVALVCRHIGLRRLHVFNLRPAMAEAFIRIFRIQLSRWDRYCMSFPDQSYDSAVNPASYGLPVVMPDISVGLQMIGVSGKS